MLYIRSLREGLPVYRALGSSTRVAIMELLLEKGPMRMTAIAQQMGITGGALTSHVKELTDAGLIYIETTGGKHGLQKICHAYDQRILTEAAPAGLEALVHQQDVPVGAFVKSEVSAPCGLAGRDGAVTPADKPDAFQTPDRDRADLVWFAEGSLTYQLNAPMAQDDKALELNISLELAAVAAVHGDRAAADVVLSVNGKQVGGWVAGPGWMGDRSPYSWWQQEWPQHGATTLISINGEGTHVDGRRVSAVKTSGLDLGQGDITLELSAQPRNRQTAGVILYGGVFGHHQRDIRTLLIYHPGKR